ncbi:MAG: MBL fold metallo-hydrolase [Planctomycetes bacterium]|nr:MBL fold metallo-hydrolase [Planctomycetota bacterium]
MPSIHSIPLAPSFFEEIGHTHIAWLGMASVVINSRGTIILIDPVIESFEKDGDLYADCGEKLRFPFPIRASEIPRADIIVYTHGDPDHYTDTSAHILAEATDAVFIATEPVCAQLRNLHIPEQRIRCSCADFTYQTKNVEIIASPAEHRYEHNGQVFWLGKDDCVGYRILSQDGCIWYPGDTRLIDPLLDIKNVDLLFYDVAEVDAHLGPAGSSALARSCGASRLFASHYGTYDLPADTYGGCSVEDCSAHLKNIDAEFLTVPPGEIVHLKQQERKEL